MIWQLFANMERREVNLTASRISISMYFFFFGFTFATWASRIPDMQQRLHLTETTLGAVLLAMPLGSFLTLPFPGYLSGKFGSRRMGFIAAVIYTLLLILIGFAPNVLLLTFFMFLFGSAGNIMNVAINTQALALEKLYKRVIISSFHGMWSIAGLAAAALGTYLTGKVFPVAYHFLVVALFSLIFFTAGLPLLLQEEPTKATKRSLFTKPGKAFIGLGLIAFCSMICQGAMFDWSGVYFKKIVTSNPRYVGIGYTAFMMSMTFVRFITDWLTHRIGFTKIIISCGAFITSGLLINVFFPSILPATIGMLLVGVGVSPAIPLVFSAAGKESALSPAVAIAAVSSIGFIGNLIGPPIIGFIAGLSSLKMSFIYLSLFGVAIAVLAVLHQKQQRHSNAV
jgi:MFS family permease